MTCSRPDGNHRWCLETRRARLTASCSCGVSTTSLEGLASVDRGAALQILDPTGLQRRFLAAAGLQPAL